MNEKLKKILASLGILGAFGFGGAAIAGAQDGAPTDKPAASQPAADEQGEADETEQKVTGADADRAGRAALTAVGDGQVLSVEKETPEQGPETPEPGEKPDSAREQAIDQKTAYEVEVQRNDGTIVEVTLDGAFNVLDSEQEDTESPSGQAAQR